jgi:hypothetical protein
MRCRLCERLPALRSSILPSAATPCAERCVIVNVGYCFCCLSLPNLARQGILLRASRPSAGWSDNNIAFHAMRSREKKEKYSSDTMPTCIHPSRTRRRKPREHPAKDQPAPALQPPRPKRACGAPVCLYRVGARPTYSEQSWAFQSAVLAMLPLGDDARPSFSALSPALGALLPACQSINRREGSSIILCGLESLDS